MRTIAIAFIGGIIGTVFASVIALAWTGPVSTPPNGNIPAPINVGSTDQVKNGGLALNALAVFGNSILSGPSITYLNFGATAQSSGYGFRDNNGTMEFKNSGGAWSNIVSTSTTFSQIKFADGTTQTTAASGGGTANVQTFLSSGTWTKPASANMTYIECWGGGGSGARSNPGGGGGGGGYNARMIQTPMLGATETVTIGAGGAAQTSNFVAGNNGGNTTFGTWLTAYGGAGGLFSNSGGGGGGGQLSAGNGTTAGRPTTEGNGGINAAGGDALWHGGGGGGDQSGPGSSVGGSSVYGGAGGGGASNTNAAGGSSSFGGNGSAGSASGSSSAGTQPGGGSGSGFTGSGAGGAGKCVVTTW